MNGFNPTLVRLALLRNPPIHDLLDRFNPTLVRLAQPRKGVGEANRPCFNPTLVRLAHLSGRARGAYKEVSIPPWFD